MGVQKTVVVGAGPVGSLAAIYAAARGDEVEIYDLRGDLRDPSTVPLNFTKSINLALSERGINSLRNAKCEGLLEAVLSETIHMEGRMIHGQKQGELFEEAQLYDIQGRSIKAVDRAGLNKRLLDELERMPNVKFYFNHKLAGADFKRRVAWFERKDPKTPRQDHAQNPTQDKADGKSTKGNGDKGEVEVSFDFLIGADGAHSSVRYHLMKYTRMNYSQEYIDTLWCEFHISPKASSSGSQTGEKTDTDWAISPHHLHIWPGGPERMFIAIPSLDHSFTCTLFTAEDNYNAISANPTENLIPFFQQNFPGVVPQLISEADLLKQYAENPHLPLISLKCTPYHFDSSVVILGDAAHAMVPFYGQGMNAGLEDVRVLYDHLDEYIHPSSSTTSTPGLATARAKALAAYTSHRHPSAVAINNLALRNYREMASDVRSPLYLFRKALEERLSVLFPALGWATQYSRVSFGNLPYDEVERLAETQKQVLLRGIWGVLGAVAVGAVWVTLRMGRMGGGGGGRGALGLEWLSRRVGELGRRFR